MAYVKVLEQCLANKFTMSITIVFYPETKLSRERFRYWAFLYLVNGWVCGQVNPIK